MITIKKAGWEISGDDESELEMAVRVVERAIEAKAGESANAGQNGHKASVRTAVRRAAKEAVRRISAAEARKATMVHESRSRSLSMLKAIKVAGSNGTKPPEMMKATGTTHAKGTGAPTAALNSLLGELGFDPEDVFTTYRTVKEGRIWKPKERIAEAIAKVEALIASNDEVADDQDE